MRGRARASMTIAAVLSATTALGFVASSAASPLSTATAESPSAHADGGTEPASPPQTVTLLTGDRVIVSTSPDGRRTASVLHGPGREDMVVQQQAVGDALYVIPADVAPLVPDVLDRDLFDVVKLADIQDDDEHRTDIPVILASAGGASVPARSTEPTTPGTQPDWGVLDVEPERRLESIDAVSARLDTGGTGDLLDALRAAHPGEGAGARAMARAAADRVTSAAESAAGDVAHVYLDEPVEPTDADSTPQIGAPPAWEAGYDRRRGHGRRSRHRHRPTHPDLDRPGRRQARTSPAPGDTTTHRARNPCRVHRGRYRSRVRRDEPRRRARREPAHRQGLNDNGNGYDSSVIAGMEWAAPRATTRQHEPRRGRHRRYRPARARPSTG